MATRPWLAKPGTVAALRVQVSDGELASKSHQGQRLAPQQKSGCTGAIYLCKPSGTESLDKWGRPCTTVNPGAISKGRFLTHTSPSRLSGFERVGAATLERVFCFLAAVPRLNSGVYRTLLSAISNTSKSNHEVPTETGQVQMVGISRCSIGQTLSERNAIHRPLLGARSGGSRPVPALERAEMPSR
jgi:hypothetical protein